MTRAVQWVRERIARLRAWLTAADQVVDEVDARGRQAQRSVEELKKSIEALRKSAHAYSKVRKKRRNQASDEEEEEASA